MFHNTDSVTSASTSQPTVTTSLPPVTTPPATTTGNNAKKYKVFFDIKSHLKNISRQMSVQNTCFSN